MNATKSKLIRRLTKAAAPLTATPAETRKVYQGMKAMYLAQPTPARRAFAARMARDAREMQAIKLAADRA